MKLSVILGGRDDDYGKDFIPRLGQAIKTNLEFLDDSGIDYEMVVVDYNPISHDKYLHRNESLQDILSHQRVRNIIIDRSVIVHQKLVPENYHEYYAKNCGIRRANGQFFFVTNSDIILSPELINDINSLRFPDADQHFYRVRYRRSIDLGSTIDKWYVCSNSYEDLNIPNLADSCIAGYCAGDATLFSRNVMSIASGYDETEIHHRGIKRQSAMDAEILWNLHHQGITLKFLESPYYHIEHERPSDRDGVYNNRLYKNEPYWGFSNYPETRINENTIMVHANESV